MVRNDSVSYFPSQNSAINMHRTRTEIPFKSSLLRSPIKSRHNNFRRDLQVVLGWTAPEHETEFNNLKRYLRSLIEKHFVMDRLGGKQDKEAINKIKQAILEEYPHIFEGSKNAKQLEEAMRFVKKEHTARRASWARNRRGRPRRVLSKKLEDKEHNTIEDFDSTPQDLADKAHSSFYSRTPPPSLPMGCTKSSPKQRRVDEFYARPSTFLVSQRTIGTARGIGASGKSISGPSTPRRDASPSPNREKSPEATRRRVMEFLQTCTPSMEIWYEPLVAFGCDNIPYLESLARWDDKSLEAALRPVKDQPNVNEKLKNINVVFLSRNLREKFQTRG